MPHLKPIFSFSQLFWTTLWSCFNASSKTASLNSILVKNVLPITNLSAICLLILLSLNTMGSSSSYELSGIIFLPICTSSLKLATSSNTWKSKRSIGSSSSFFFLDFFLLPFTSDYSSPPYSISSSLLDSVCSSLPLALSDSELSFVYSTSSSLYKI